MPDSMLKIETRYGPSGALADAASVTLTDPTGAFGVRRTDTQAVVVAANTVMPRVSPGKYEYGVVGTNSSVNYEWWAKIIDSDGNVIYSEGILSAISTDSLAAFTSDTQAILAAIATRASQTSVDAIAADLTDGVEIEDSDVQAIITGVGTGTGIEVNAEQIGDAVRAELNAELQRILIALPNASPGANDGLARVGDLPDVSAGNGDILVDNNYGGTDALTITDSIGNPIDEATIRAYLTSEYNAGNYTNVLASATTGTDGKWIAPMMLDAGQYTLIVSATGQQSQRRDISVV
jgi:hypothetical protein